MSLRIQTIVSIWAGLACFGHGRRVKASNEQFEDDGWSEKQSNFAEERLPSSQSPLNVNQASEELNRLADLLVRLNPSLDMLLDSANPLAAFSHSGLGLAQRKPVVDRIRHPAPLMRGAPNLPVLDRPEGSRPVGGSQPVVIPQSGTSLGQVKKVWDGGKALATFEHVQAAMASVKTMPGRRKGPITVTEMRNELRANGATIPPGYSIRGFIRSFGPKMRLFATRFVELVDETGEKQSFRKRKNLRSPTLQRVLETIAKLGKESGSGSCLLKDLAIQLRRDNVLVPAGMTLETFIKCYRDEIKLFGPEGSERVKGLNLYIDKRSQTSVQRIQDIIRTHGPMPTKELKYRLLDQSRRVRGLTTLIREYDNIFQVTNRVVSLVDGNKTATDAVGVKSGGVSTGIIRFKTLDIPMLDQDTLLLKLTQAPEVIIVDMDKKVQAFSFEYAIDRAIENPNVLVTLFCSIRINPWIGRSNVDKIASLVDQGRLTLITPEYDFKNCADFLVSFWTGWMHFHAAPNTRFVMSTRDSDGLGRALADVLVNNSREVLSNPTFLQEPYLYDEPDDRKATLGEVPFVNRSTRERPGMSFLRSMNTTRINTTSSLPQLSKMKDIILIDMDNRKNAMEYALRRAALSPETMIIAFCSLEHNSRWGARAAANIQTLGSKGQLFVNEATTNKKNAADMVFAFWTGWLEARALRDTKLSIVSNDYALVATLTFVLKALRRPMENNPAYLDHNRMW